LSISAAAIAAPVRKHGRPSRHPALIRYYEAPAIAALLEQEADRQGMSLSQLQRLVTRAGIQALNLNVELQPVSILAAGKTS
jgi:hypothetical protein